MSEQPIIDRLDQILAVLQLAHFDAIQRASQEIRRDRVKAAVLEACESDWITAGALRSRVQQETGAQTRTIQRHVAELVARRAIFERGATTDRAYKATNLI